MWKPDSNHVPNTPVAVGGSSSSPTFFLALAYEVCAHSGIDPFDTELALVLNQPIHRRNTEVLADWLTWGFGAAELTEPEALHFVPVFTALFGEYLPSRRH